MCKCFHNSLHLIRLEHKMPTNKIIKWSLHKNKDLKNNDAVPCHWSEKMASLKYKNQTEDGLSVYL